jgi:4-diphosphocytidyl-2-C-methyl-D-erythritol kinase
MITEFAPAKVNLALHVTGRRTDGYHDLDSLVVFAGVGDRVTVQASGQASDEQVFDITGPQAAGLPMMPDNSVLRAAAAFGDARGARITLHKVLPVASGIGGGSADAAAALRALAALWGIALPGADDVLALGADVPVCLAGRPARMTGIGEHVVTLPHALPQAWLALVNPGVAMSTPAVFKAMTRRDNPPLPDAVPRWDDAGAMAAFLRGQRNDLEAPAIAIAPVIADVKAALDAQPGCLLARMSGSGATCFGLFGDAKAAAVAAGNITRAQPGWWVADASIMG